MDKSKDQNHPAPKPAVDKEPLVKARVRASNHYAGRDPGEIVEVTAAELRRVPHALISVEDEKMILEEAAKPKPPTAGQKMFRGLKKSMIAANKAQQEAKAVLMRKHLETLGVKVQ